MGKEKKVNLKDVKKYSNSSVSDSTLKRLRTNNADDGKKKLTAGEMAKKGAEWSKKIADSGVLTDLAEMSKGEALGGSGSVREEKPSPFFDTNKDYEIASAAIDKLYPK